MRLAGRLALLGIVLLAPSAYAARTFGGWWRNVWDSAAGGGSTFYVAPTATTCAKSCTTPADCGVDGVCTAANSGSICTAGDAFGDGSIGNPYQSLNYALRNGRPACGDTVLLRAGVYRQSLTSSFDDSTAAKRLQGCDDDDTDDSGNDGIKTILPILGSVGGVARYNCTLGHELTIENYPGEAAVIDSSDVDFDGAVWSACTGTAPTVTCCGTTGLSIPAPSSTYCTTGFNFGSANISQLWADPTTTDPGTRLPFYCNNAACATPTVCTTHDLIPSGTNGFFACGGATLLLVARFADNSSPASHVMRASVQTGDGAASAMTFNNSASHVTVKQNSTGTLAMRYGREIIAVHGTSDSNTIDGLTLVGGGTRDYGHCFRNDSGSNNTIKNVTCHETMSEGIAFYGGGCGVACDGSNSGIQLSGNSVLTSTVYNSGLGWLDGGGAGGSLGMGIILKNCTNCLARGNTVHTTYRDGIEVTTSTDCTGNTVACHSDNTVVDGNTTYDNGHYNVQTGAYPGTQGGCGIGTCGCINVQPLGTALPGVIDAPRISNNQCYGAYTGTVGTQGASGIVVQGAAGGNAVTNAIVANNSMNNINGPCLNVDGNTSPVTFTNNAMALCGQTGVVCNSGICDLYTDNSTTHVHLTNTYWSANAGDRVIEKQGGSNFTRATAATFEASAVQVDPTYVSSTNLDLQGTSGLINAGTDLSGSGFAIDFHGTARPQSVAWDIGMDEVTNVTTSTSTTTTSSSTSTSTTVPTSVQVMTVGAGAAPSTSAANYEAISGTTQAWTGTQNTIETVVPAAGTFGGMRVVLPTAPGAGTSYATVLMLNEVATSLTCTVSDAATTCQDATNGHNVIVVAGDRVNWRVTPTGTPASSNIRISVLWKPTTSDQTILTSANETSVDTTAEFLAPLSGNGGSAVETNGNRMVMPAAGTFTSLYVWCNGNVAAAATRVFAFRNNASDTTLTCTVVAGAATCNDTNAGHNQTVAAGDLVTYHYTATGSPTAKACSVSAVFVPTTTQHYVAGMVGGVTTPTTATDKFTMLSGQGTAGGTTEDSTVQRIAQASTIKAIYVQLELGANGAASVLATTLNKNGSGTLETCVITNAQTCNAALDVTVADDDLLSVNYHHTGSAGTGRTGLVSFDAVFTGTFP